MQLSTYVISDILPSRDLLTAFWSLTLFASLQLIIRAFCNALNTIYHYHKCCSRVLQIWILCCLILHHPRLSELRVQIAEIRVNNWKIYSLASATNIPLCFLSRRNCIFWSFLVPAHEWSEGGSKWPCVKSMLFNVTNTSWSSLLCLFSFYCAFVG